MIKNIKNIKKISIILASIVTVTSVTLTTVSCGSGNSLNTEDGNWISSQGSDELKELYYTGVAKDLYKYTGSNDRMIDIFDKLSPSKNNSYLNMKEYLLLNNLWSIANSSAQKSNSANEIYETMLVTKDFSDYTDKYKTALTFLLDNDLHNILNGTAEQDNVLITNQQIVEIMNIYYNVSQSERITINKQMIDMYYLNSEKSYNSLYNNDYLVQAIQQYRPAMLWSIANTKDSIISNMDTMGKNLNTAIQANPQNLATAWNKKFGNSEFATEPNSKIRFNTDVQSYKYNLSNLGILPWSNQASNNSFKKYNQLYNFSGMKFTGDSLADDSSTLSLFGYNLKDQANPVNQDNIVVTKSIDATANNQYYAHGTVSNYNVYYAKNFINKYNQPSQGLPFGQFKLPTNITDDSSNTLKDYVATQLITKIEANALSFYQARYYIDVTNDDVKKIQPSGTKQ